MNYKIINEKEAIESLFHRGGTKINGDYIVIDSNQRRNTKQVLFSFNGKKYCVNKHNVLCNVTQLDNNKKWYSISMDFSRLGLSYKQEKELSTNIWKIFKGEK